MSLDTRVIRATPVGADVTRWTKVIPFILIVMAQASVGHLRVNAPEKTAFESKSRESLEAVTLPSIYIQWRVEFGARRYPVWQ